MENTTSTGPGDPRTVTQLFSDLWRQTTALLRDEAELAKAEISEKVTQVGSGVTSVAAGGAIAFAGFLLLLFAASNALAQVLSPDLAPWLAPLIVGAVVLVVGLIALAKGRKNLKSTNLKPERSVHSLDRDRELAKEHFK